MMRMMRRRRSGGVGSGAHGLQRKDNGKELVSVLES